MPPKKGYFVNYLDDSLSLAVIHSFSKYLLSTYYVLSRAGDSMGNKMHSCSPRAHRLKGGQGDRWCRSRVCVSTEKGAECGFEWDLRGALPRELWFGMRDRLKASSKCSF